MIGTKCRHSARRSGPVPAPGGILSGPLALGIGIAAKSERIRVPYLTDALLDNSNRITSAAGLTTRVQPVPRADVDDADLLPMVYGGR
jgi:hypothetical protein